MRFGLDDGDTRTLQEVGNAQIFTIHSFCQNVLKYYAYETKSSLNLQQVNDNNIDSLVDKFIRDKWKNNKAPTSSSGLSNSTCF